MRSVGALVFDDFELLDLFGPLEMLAMHADAFRIEIIAEAREIRGCGGPRLLADRRLEEAGPYDVLLVPGGMGTRREMANRRLIDWLGRQADAAATVATVCTGSALMAATGRLDGRRATSNKQAFQWVRAQRPAVHWIGRARWVVDGKFYTASGVSAGIDMALALIGDLIGARAAEDAADWAEYRRERDSRQDPFAARYGHSDT